MPHSAGTAFKVVIMATFNALVTPTLESEMVSLRELSSVWFEDAAEMYRDPVVRAALGIKRTPMWLQPPSVASAENRTPIWAILSQEIGDFAGLISIFDLDETVGEASVQICLSPGVGTGRGIGGAAMALVLKYLFEQQKLNRVHAVIPVGNARAIRFFADHGFEPGRQFGLAPNRMQRMAAGKLNYIEALAKSEMARHLDVKVWEFSWDSAKRRAGLCDHTHRRISLSRYLSEHNPLDQSHQVMLHEIAHAMVGHRHGHDAKWLATAKGIGYRNEQISGRSVDEEEARWMGICPNGHEYFRYKKPQRISSCSKCSKTFNESYLISWNPRW